MAPSDRQRLRSLFEHHPDGVMLLRDDGVIGQVNVAAGRAMGFDGDQLVGQCWSNVVAPECRADAEEAFRSAMRGEACEFQTLLLDRSGHRLDVQLKLVPVGEKAEGVYAIVRNATLQKRAERAMAEQAERIRRLYLVAAARGDSVEGQIDGVLDLGCTLFGFDYGYVTRVDRGTVTILNAVGGRSPVQTGNVYPREASLSRYLMETLDTLFVPDLDEPPWRSDPARASAPWRSYFGSKLVVNQRDFGALVFTSRIPRAAGLADADRDLMKLMGLFVAAALERAQHAERIEQLAFYDSLTGLPNRVLFADRFRQTMAAAKRYNRGFAVMYLDLDDFKEINDRYGHPVGDLVLRAAAERLSATLRESDTIARFGGDEFVIVQPVVDTPADASNLARKIVKRMQVPLEIEGQAHVVHVSIGVALYPRDGKTSDDLMEKADRALYRAKNAGRNRWCFYDSDYPMRQLPGLKHSR